MIETLQQWNTRLGYCGCCPMPECPAPVVVCQSMNLSIGPDGGYLDADGIPGGAFDLVLWKKYKKRSTEHSCTLAVNDDTTGGGSGGGTHEIGSGSLTVTTTETYDEVWYKGGCTPFDNTLTTTYTGNGSFNVQYWYEYLCGGVWYKRKGQETVTTFTYVGGDANPSPPPAFYDDDFWRRDSTNDLYSYYCDTGVLVANPPVTDNQTDYWTSPFVITTAAAAVHPDRVITIDHTYEQPVTWADFEAEMLAWITTNKEAGCWANTGTCKAIRSSIPPATYMSGGGTITATPLRFRFRIPTAHLGTKFTITYDIAEFPTGGDPSFLSEDNVVEWTGPGTGSSSDPSWLTPFVEIDPPEVPGERRIVNIRFTCYTGTKYGVKPQVMGEALELEEPEP